MHMLAPVDEALDLVSRADLDLKAPLADPTLTGVPTAPTAAVGTSTAQIASTAFVVNQIAAIPKSDTALWTYDTSTTMADPGSGKMRTDGSGAGSTRIAFDVITSQGTDRTDLLSTLRAEDIIFMQEQTNALNWVRYKVTGIPTNGSGWFLVPVAAVNSGGTEPSKNASIIVRFNYGSGAGVGAVTRSITVITGAITGGSTANTDYVYVCSGASAYTVTLPTAVGNKNLYTIKRTATANISIATTGGETIDGVNATTTPFVIDTQYMSIDLISDNTGWVIV